MRRALALVAATAVWAGALFPAAAMTTGEKVVAIAKELAPKVQYQRHVYDPERYIFDCSGFVYTVFKMAGIDLGTRDDDVQARRGIPVDKSDLRPGDLVYFNHNPDDPDDVTHIGIYIGDGKYIHNFNSKVDVTISDLNKGWHKRYYKGARRVIGV